MQVIINKPVAVDVKFPLYFKAGASSYAVLNETEAIVSHWWDPIGRGWLSANTAEEALREYQPGSEITADEFRAAAAQTFNFIQSKYQQFTK